MARILYFDCFSGAAGDMVLGALIDAGVPSEAIREGVGSLAVPGADLDVERVSRGGIGATRVRLSQTGQDELGSFHHGGPDQTEGNTPAHRSLAAIARHVDGSTLSASAKDRAKSLFRRLGEIEADIHRQPLEQVHLHEVGALDSIIDIVGSVFALEWLGVDRIVSSPLNVGSGTVECAHGTLPVPAPATARLLAGVPIYAKGPAMELVTPTGALLVTSYASAYGPIPPMTLETVGYGAGDRDVPGSPNVLRVLIGEDQADPTTERVLVIECEIDDMNPQIYGVLLELLYDAGALEVFYAPVYMKKNRPGTLVTVVAKPSDRDTLAGILFRETTTIGVRSQEVDRERLERSSVSVMTPLGPVRFKLARRQGRIVNAAPEFEDCAELAARSGRSVKEVQAEATRAYLERGDAIT